MKKHFFVGIFSLAFGIISITEASIPKELRTTNVTDSQITLSWITDVAETCAIHYGQTPALGQTAYDVHGQNTVDDTHYVNITGLSPETLYYFELVSGATIDNNNGAYYQCKTGANIKPSGIDFAYGKVFKSDAITKATGTIVYFKLSDADAKGSPGESAVWSVLVDASGYWSENLINIRTQALSGFFDYSVDGGDNLVLFAQGANDGTATLTAATNQDSPAPDIILSTDHIKPSNINTLEITQVTSNSIRLKWLAPGDDGDQGQASLYDIRWSLSPINEGNFGNAVQVQGEPLPLPAGTQQQFVVPTLSPNTLYYLAMKTRDEANNWSDLSNVVSAKTLPAPNSMLDWTGENNFVKDALRLDLGTSGTNFVYMVKYTHPENLPPPKGEPKIILYKGATALGTYSTTYVKGSFSTGAIYTYSKVFQVSDLPENGEYSYKFYTQGAEGEPIFLTKGPIVMDIPTTVRITNQTDAQWTVSWITSQSVIGQVKYGINSHALDMTGDDDRGTGFSGRTHHITIRNLSPETVYYFDVVSGGVVDNNSGSHYIVWTGKSLVSSGSNIVYGKVFKQGGQGPAKDTLVYLELKDNDGQGSSLTSAPVSALVEDNGYWMADLVNFRTLDLASQFEYSTTADELYLFAQGAEEGIGSEIVLTLNDSPALPIELCQDVVAPASITTLQVIKAGVGSITLRWQASGDDKNIGQAAIYDLRYGTSYFTEPVWGLTEEVKLEPTPAPAGTAQEFVVKGLNPATTYFFGLKVIDEVWNMSELSGVIEGSTTPEMKHNPTLDWLGAGEYLKDGVYPDSGNIDMEFTFKVKYIDLDGDAPLANEPKVIIYKDGLSIGTHSMSYVQGTYTTGAVYKFPRFFSTPGTYAYRFFATDASGTAAVTQPGPIVSGIPYRETNITDSQFTISWTSAKQEIGTINYGTNPNSLNQSDFDDRGIGYVDDTHHITITGLSANILYYYDVVSGGVLDNNNGFHYTVKTGASIIPKPENRYSQGEVYKQGKLEYADGAIVYIQLQDVDKAGDWGTSSWASVLVTGGQWLYNLVNLRAADLQSFFDDWTPDKDNLELFAEGGLEGTDTQTIYPINANPAPYMELSRDITPPGTTTLTATNTTAVSTTLFWMAPGDDKQLGTAATYDIRYSTGVINEDTWLTAKQVSNEPVPRAAGSWQQITITGLEPTTQYYLGLKTIDEADNASLLTIATITTPPHPPPILKWTGEEGYVEDGLEPERGCDETIFTYKVAYFHETNFPPANNFPKLHIQKSGNEVSGSPYSMQEVDHNDTEYTDGKLYKFLKTFSLPGTYTYWFEAEDTLGVKAKGTPTTPSSGPWVGKIPVLTWTNELGYTTDGLEPETGNIGATFTYRVKFSHAQDVPPAQGYPKVYIYLGTAPIGSFTLEEVNQQDTDYTNGKLYTLLIPLNTAGKYYYRFEAKDKDDFMATGEPTQLKTGPIVAKAPMLVWVDENGYKTEGIEPNQGINTTIFTYKVRYCDEDNTPPDAYSPKLYILRGGEVVYQKKLYRESGNDYVSGIVYVIKLPLVFASEYYSYYFEAKNTLGVLARGTPTTTQPGPLVTGLNYPPRLLWVGNQGYVSDGLEPEIGNFDTAFNYCIKYSDLNADPPKEGYPLLYVYKGGAFIGTKTMDYLSGTFPSGAVYRATYTFKATGIYQYKFEAMDKKGLQCWTALKSGPIVSNAPILEWIGGEGYNADGLEPEAGTVNLTAFTYKVSYKDIDNDPPYGFYPVVHIFKEGKEISGSPYRMEAIDPSDYTYNNGKEYKLTKFFDQTGSFTYQFEAYDYLRIPAVGTPTNIFPSPVVRSIPTLTWPYEEGYVNDGLEPETGDLQTTFTWRVNWTDMDGDAPLSNYPVVHILKAGTEIENSPFRCNAVDFNDVNYKDGKLFTYSSSVPDTGTYAYYFEGYDCMNNRATGSAGLLKNGPTIITSPILKWAGTEGYISDGINPGTGTIQSTTFTYKVLYLDPEGNPPTDKYPRVHILLGGAEIYSGGQWMYLKEGNDYKTGVTYSFPTRLLTGSRHYTYYFEAKNIKGITAIGEATLEQDGPIVDGPNFKPILFWSVNPGFVSDGLDPDVGTPGTKFTYQIRYVDMNGDHPDNNYPLVYIYKNTVLMATVTMNFVSGNFLQGALYSYSTPLPEKNQYQYQFRVQDEYGGEVLFPPSSFMPGPKVSGSPVLEWTGQQGFIDDGLEPEIGAIGTTFTYRVLYSDEDNEPPQIGFPELQIQKGDVNILDTPMSETDPQDKRYVDGKVYECFYPLNLPGTYTYRFEAKDTNGVYASGGPTIFHSGPMVVSIPSLTWVGVDEFMADGLNPEIGTPGTKFTFRIVYTDRGKLPPGTGSPKVNILLNQQPYISFGMQAEDIFDDDYTDGKIYRASFSLPSGTYTYKFEAENIYGAKAGGQPVLWEQPGPRISNAPILNWVTEYQTCGVKPGTGTKDTLFTYKVEYKDDDPPSSLYPRVRILRDGIDIQGSPFKMDEVDINDNTYTNGKEYKFSTYLFHSINYTYRFEAKDTFGVEAIGTATQWQAGPIVNNFPALIWAGQAGYIEDGVEPDVGTTGTEFTFLIKYKDMDDDPPGTGSPKVHIFKAGRSITGSPFAMTLVNPGGSFIAGKIYKLSITFAENGTYSYRFESEDIQGSQAVGEPTQKVWDGPVVSNVPTLNWIGEGDYLHSGVSPPLGTIGTEFIYLIDYTDLDNDPPLDGFPQVAIFLNAVKIPGSPFKMDEVNPQDTNYRDGKRYKLAKYLPSAGTYSYQFIAQDSRGISAGGEPTKIKEGPLISGEPILVWVGREPYLKDGVDPDIGTVISFFTYKVKYSDVNNSPPAPGYPKLFVLIEGQISPLYPTGVLMRPEGVPDYQKGVVYYTSPIRLPVASTKYSYYFIAKNLQGKVAYGTPTTIQSGPEVTGNNSRPMLMWANQLGYISDGLEPEAGTSGTEFTYLIIYKDMNGDKPYFGYPLLHIYKDQTFIGTYTMEKQSGSFTTGALYCYKITLTGYGNYKYKFEAKDIKKDDCLPSAPTSFRQGPRIGSPPQLQWLGTGSFQSDGLDPETGIANETIFSYKVKYQDNEGDQPANGYPRLHILKKGMETESSPFPLEPVDVNDKNYQDGKEYQFLSRLISAGTDYTYYFEAKDAYGVYAAGTPTYSTAGPIVTGEPLLNWAKDNPGYMSDGLEPEFGTPGTSLSYRICYVNSSNDPPGTNSPRLHIFKLGAEIPASPWTMVQEGPDINYEDGKLYSCSLSLGVGTYTYRFAAESNRGIPATGTATFIKNGPTVTLAPVLSWVNKPGYGTNGLHPEAGSATTPFVYRVIYTDTEPPALGYPKVHILKAGKEIAGSPFGMQETLPGDTNYADGKEYDYTRVLTATGKDYEYFFEAKDSTGVFAVGGEPVTLRPTAPVVTDAPILSWVQEANYATNGLHPEFGTWGTKFTYKVTYSDANNDLPNQGFPKVHIQKGGAEISGSPWTMFEVTPTDQNCVDGKDYYFVQTIQATGRDYTYSFEAEDTWGIKASGAPTLPQNAPDVSRPPVLSWSGNPGFIEDGIDPELGTQGTKFTWQVKYEDADSDPPYSGFPKVHIYSGSTPVGSFSMNPVNAGIYKYEANLPVGSYSYCFEAKDSYQLQAMGTPTFFKNNPVVTDAPILDWVQEPGFGTDGIKPDSGDSATIFTYKINYIDDNPPSDGYPKVIIYKGATVLGTYPMIAVSQEDVTYTDGKLYYYPLQFAESRFDYKYKFVAKDFHGMDAVGKIQVMNGPPVNNPPTLNWTGEPGYTNDGIEPDYGTTKVVYTYRIKYVDKDNHPPSEGYPKLYIYVRGTLTKGSPIPMNPVNPNDGTYTDGRLYTFFTNFQEGTYSYKFEAKDFYSAEAMTSVKPGPSVSDAPTLNWVNQTGFGTDGVNPDPGQTTNRFTYKILYTDVNNLPLADGYPKIYIYIGGVLIYPGYILAKETQGSYSAGVVYSFNEISLPYASEGYSYYFEAKNSNNVAAIGEATTLHFGPKVEGLNYPPLLFSTQEKEYYSDGVEPDAASPGNFIFHVAYLDMNVNPPASGYPAVIIYKDNKPYGLGTYSMTYLNGGYFKGATYTRTIILNDLGIYKYKFYAKDNKGGVAVGPFTILKTGPKVSHAPKLEWAGSPNFETDGLDPEEGIVTQTYFTFKVKYRDEDGDAPGTDYPKLCLVNNETPVGKIKMFVESGNDYKTGKIYYYILRLGEVSDKYKYYFEAKDAMDVLALGTPTLQRLGPKVKPASPASPEIVQTLESLEIFNYPNPHSGKTTICAKTNLVGVPIDMQVAVYNIVGELIWKGVSVDGKAEIVWDAKNIASGVYLYRVTVTYRGKTMQRTSKMAITR